ncbi:peptigoglycan-binding protein LysM [Paenibacillus pectinilyticus]|uniref:Peptigoglycan-binding protein LysM n=1 Tax=Paenibacillus pectinilyticus TaxID=512399 RepID=A0A1C0ZZW3_9BACL|nr:glycosyltransferase [Paenibacillus pectinilyticus]OCT13673.1 peptigoglycan-binding protein LysM [Paenibacillus pectinilyticus]
MRILFLEYHPMWIHGLPNGFRDLGHEVKISGKLTKHQMGRMIASFKPDLIITLGWTLQHKPHRRPWIRQYVGKSQVPHVFWATEDPTHFETFSHRYVKAVKPDFVFTICRANVNKYESLGFPSAHMDFGYHAKVHRKSKPYKKFRSEIAVVANGYSHILKKYPKHYRIQSLQTLIRPLVQDKVRIDFWGRQWDKMKPILGASVPKSHIHGYLDYPEARKVYNSAKIVIGPQNQLTQVTQRTYEILGSGGFLLTSDTPEIRRLFEPGKHLVVSQSAKETKRLVTYYLNHPTERENIREAGYRAVSQHSYKSRAAYMLRVLHERGILINESMRSYHLGSRNKNLD